MMLNTRGKLYSLLLLSALISNAHAETSDIEKARSLIAAKKYQEAYKILEPLESSMAGDVGYDYLLGVAGVESGQVTRGVFALERVLAVEPNNQPARAEIAKAHYKLGEADTAKAELNNLLSEKPDAETVNAINRYMNAIDKSLGLTTTFAAYLDFGLGFDTNINSATSADAISAPGIRPGVFFNLSNRSQETSDSFKTLSGGVSLRSPINKTLSWFSGVNVANRFNNQDEQFNNLYLDFNLGLKYQHLKNTVSAALQVSEFELDSERFRNSHGATAQWQYDWDGRNQTNVYGQFARLTYKGAEIRDADRATLGAGWIHVFEGDKSPIIFVSPYIGQEETRRSAGDFLSFDFYGLRVGGQLSFTPKWVGYVSTGYENRNYDQRDPIFLKTRDDEQYEISIGARFTPMRNWLIKPQLSYIDSQSNIVLNDFDRTVLSVNFRHDFNW